VLKGKPQKQPEKIDRHIVYQRRTIGTKTDFTPGTVSSRVNEVSPEKHWKFEICHLITLHPLKIFFKT
jgi:hypothetical protein